MATTDLHVHVWPHDYFADRPVVTQGLARTAGLIAASRAEVANALLLDNGDMLLGSPLGDLAVLSGRLARGGVHPMIAAMNRLGYDAATLGNHEFNHGLAFLGQALAGARFPVVCANVVMHPGAEAGEDRTLLPPWVILDRMLVDGAGVPHPVRIGVIGFVPPQIMIWDQDHLRGRVAARDIVATARALVPKLRAAGADLVIALAHSGIGAAVSVEGMENAAVPLAAVPGIDAVVAGHSHLVFPSPVFAGLPGVDAARGTLMGKPAVMAGCFGTHLGLIDVTLGRRAGSWRVVRATSETRPIARRNPDGTVTALTRRVPAVLNAVRRAHQATLAHIRLPVGRSTVALHSHFAMVAGASAVQVVAAAQHWHVARALRGTAQADLPLLSAAAPFKAGGRGGPEYYTDVPPGDLTLRNVADLYLYPNTIRAVEVTGADLRDWLERAAAVFSRLTPGQTDQPLLDPDVPTSQFDVISGVTYRIDLSQPARFAPEGALARPTAQRIIDLCHQGRPIGAQDRFVIATNSYRAGGGGAFPGTGDRAIIIAGTATNRDVLRDFIVATGTITDLPPCPWQFAPLPGTSVLFDTSPRATAHLGDLPGTAPEPAGRTPGGFARFRLRL